jgi:AbrB family looped-hinge helix DNA binding protein
MQAFGFASPAKHFFASMAETLNFDEVSICKITIIGAMNPYACQATPTFHQGRPQMAYSIQCGTVAWKTVVDESGRVLIPQELREETGLEEGTVVKVERGKGKTIQIAPLKGAGRLTWKDLNDIKPKDRQTGMANARRNQEHLGIVTNVLVAYVDARHHIRQGPSRARRGQVRWIRPLGPATPGRVGGVTLEASAKTHHEGLKGIPGSVEERYQSSRSTTK